MIIKTKSLLLFSANNFQTKVVFQREHVVSFDCQGIISFKGHVAHISPGEAIVLPKTLRFIFSYIATTAQKLRYTDTMMSLQKPGIPLVFWLNMLIRITS